MFTLYSADFIGNPGNCSYPHKTVVMDADSMRDAVGHDYVCAEYKNHYRNSDNFLSADCLPVDCDNDHSEDPKVLCSCRCRYYNFLALSDRASL